VDGSLTVHIEDAAFDLQVGDLVSYQSSRSHQIKNESDRNASAIWINVDR
jgi:mannose-6-phosphate isomerase-like protein (cupin superfamily)